MLMKVLCDTLNAISWAWSHYGAFQSQLGAPQSGVDKHHLLIRHCGKDDLQLLWTEEKKKERDSFLNSCENYVESVLQNFIVSQTHKKKLQCVSDVCACMC